MKKLSILVVGGGGREHALVWKLAQSPLAGKMFAAPGNPGMENLAELVPIAAEDIDGLTAFARAQSVDLVVVGPEGPLALGLADRLEAAGLTVFGPKAAAARLESSKTFAKDFMGRHRVPTAAYRCFTNADEALAYLRSRPDAPIVVKASGLAQGKGVTVAQNRAEAEEAVREAMEESRFGAAGHEVVIEDFIDGEEVTVLAFCDGRTILPMPPTQDHKRLEEGDLGPNTGGMGAYSPVAAYTDALAEEALATIIRPTLAGLAADGLDYRGCLYFGLILPSAGSLYKGPQVIEYNVRFGDPEAEVLMPLLEADLVETMLLCAQGKLNEAQLHWSSDATACAVMVSGGYPGKYATGLAISEDPASNDALVFHAGTAKSAAGTLVTAGGRVLTVTARGATLEGALALVYSRLDSISFQDSFFRRDIAHRELARRAK